MVRGTLFFLFVFFFKAPPCCSCPSLAPGTTLGSSFSCLVVLVGSILTEAELRNHLVVLEGHFVFSPHPHPTFFTLFPQSPALVAGVSQGLSCAVPPGRHLPPVSLASRDALAWRASLAAVLWLLPPVAPSSWCWPHRWVLGWVVTWVPGSYFTSWAGLLPGPNRGFFCLFQK